MTFGKRILLFVSIALLLLLASAAAVIVYYYRHPASVKPIIEKSIARATGSSFRIENLYYSIRPLGFRVEGITFEPAEGDRGFHAEIPHVVARMALEGSFGNKTLVFKELEIERFSLKFTRQIALSEATPPEGGRSFFGGLLRELIGLFLFRDIKLEKGDISGGLISAQLGDRSLRITGVQANLSPDHPVEMTCGIQVQWPSRGVTAVAPTVHVAMDRAISFVDPEIECAFNADKISFESPEVAVEGMKMLAKLSYHHGRGTLAFEPLDLYLESVNLRREFEERPDSLSLSLKTEGHINLKTKRVKASPFSLKANDSLAFKGELKAKFQPMDLIVLELVEGRFIPDQLRPILPAGMQERLAPVTVTGPIVFAGRIQGTKEPEKWLWRGDLESKFNQNEFSYRDGSFRLKGTVNGKIRFSGELPKVKTSATLQIPRSEMAAGQKAVRVDDVRIELPEGTVDGAKRAFLFPEIRVDSSLLKNLLFSLSMDDKGAMLEVRGENTRFAKAASALGILPAGWGSKGLDTLHIKASLRDGRYGSFTSGLTLKGFGIQNPDATFIGEGISSHARIEGKLDLEESTLTADGGVRVDAGEVLYDRFYFDLANNPFISDFRGSYRPSVGSLKLSGLRLGLKDILNLDLSGTLIQKTRKRRMDLSLRIPETPLRAPFHSFIVEPFQAEKPFLGEWKIGGTISAVLKLTGEEDHWTARGSCSWRKGRVSLESKGLSVRGIDLELPIWCRSPGSNNRLEVSHAERDSSPATPPASPGTPRSSAGKETLKGNLSIESVSLPLIPEQSLSLPLSAGPNRISVKSETIVRVPGGEVRLGPLVCRELYSSKPSIETSLALDALDLQPFLHTMWPKNTQGAAKGRLDTLQIVGDTVTTRGEIGIDVFGGHVTLSGLGASGIFTASPLLRFNARWENLNLMKLTEETSFGRIEGSLLGYVENLEIAYGQPQRFNLLVETARKQGQPQKISVKALDNIARIGGGQSPFMGLAGAFASFFRDFPYKKIGVRASLENDVFRINGTIKEGEKEYLVKRSGISGVDVVNQNPDNRISFKDMVKRIKRVTEQGSGPVVK